jgi:NAD+ synthase (glutamine-hydrolysing)
MRITLCQINPTVGAIEKNKDAIVSCIEKAKEEDSDLVVFPEMAICGYPPEDLLLMPGFVEKIEEALEIIKKATIGITAIVGCVRKNNNAHDKPLCNSAAVLRNGTLLGYQDKALLPTYDVFDERRFFQPAFEEKIWEIQDKKNRATKKIGITICEDIWAFSGEGNPIYSHDPLEAFAKNKIDLLVNISASPYSSDKIELRKKVCELAAQKVGAPIVLCNQVGANDGLLFDGTSTVVLPTGKTIKELGSFHEEHCSFDLEESSQASEAAAIKQQDKKEAELFYALCMALKDYFCKQGFKKAVVGLSGGIDSALVASIARAALGKENVLGVLLPSRFTSKASIEDALHLASNLGINTYEIPIEKVFTTTLETLDPFLAGKPFDVTEENMQARIRALLLMAICNKTGALLLNTSNKSELAVGYSTLYGDSCGAVSVIGDLLKTEVYAISDWIMHAFGWIPPTILTKEPSAELDYNQKDSDTLPQYAVLDPIISDYVVHRKTKEEIAERQGVSLALVSGIIDRIHKNEYKRRQCPFAFRVSEKAFAFGRKIPIVHKFYF